LSDSSSEAKPIQRVHRSFALGLLCGVLSVGAGHWLIDRTPVADWVVRPLLVEDTNGRADAIVALGAGVVRDCVPNNYGLHRTLLAVRLWREGRAPTIVFTGGTRDTCPIASAMAQLARDVGVPDASIQLETTSTSTHENGTRTAPLLHQLGGRRVLVVTDRLHMTRAAGVFERLGFDVERASVPIYEGHADNVSMLAMGLREYVALVYYRMRGWVSSDMAKPLTTDGATRRSDGGDPAGGGTGGDAAIQSRSGKSERVVVVLGASYAGGWQLDRLAGSAVVNRGVTGQQSFELLERFERDVLPVGPRAVLIWGFINDFFRNAPQDSEAVTARIRESYTRMVALSRSHGIEPIVATEVTLRPLDSWSERLAGMVAAWRGKEGYQDAINRRVLSVNQWLKELAAHEHLLLLDFQAALAEPGGRRRREFTQDDGSHITAAGYAALTAYATPVLERHFSAAPAP
jgi:uncharacterized SAM-binding protein YcdF (DUF218 family)/lysophospholipase L1-like esterase